MEQAEEKITQRQCRLGLREVRWQMNSSLEFSSFCLRSPAIQLLFGAAGQSGNAPVYPLPDITVKLVPALRQLHMSWKISGQESKSLSERKNKWENFAAAMKSKIHICFKACISGQYHVIWFYQVSKLCGKNQLCLRFLLKIFLMHKASSGNSLLPFKDAQSLKIIPLL